MTHAVSATYTRFTHMSPTAAVMAATLHVLTALAIWWVSPLNHKDLAEEAIEVTIEQPAPPEAKPEPPPPRAPPASPPAQAAPPSLPAPVQSAPLTLGAPPPTTTQAPQEQLGVPPPKSSTAEPTQQEPPNPEPQQALTPNEPPQHEPAKPEPEQALAPKEPPPKPEPAPPLEKSPPAVEAAPAKPATLEPTPQEPAKPELQQALAAKAPPKPEPVPPLEKSLPAVEPPPPPLSMQDFVRLAPPPSTIIKPPTAPPLRAPAPPPPAPQRPQSSPLNHLQQQQQRQQSAPANSGATATFVNPSSTYTRTRAQDDYLWQVIRKFSQYLPNLREKNEGGTVVIRMVIARDGRLLDVSVAHSSGIVALDRGLLESIRAASPYPALPAEIPGDQIVFTQPITAKR